MGAISRILPSVEDFTPETPETRFTQFLRKSFLFKQIQVSKDQIQTIDNEPAILVEGKYVKAQDLYKRFSIEQSPAYGRPFLVETATRKVFTYLDNGKGLEAHHPFLSDYKAVSTVSDGDYQKILQKAHTFVRPEEAHLSENERQEKNAKRTFVLQYVVARKDSGSSHYHNLIGNPQHAYLRLVIGEDNPVLGTKKGEVYEAGYGVPHHPKIPLRTAQGSLQSPDSYEYTDMEKTVTNIPISQEEAHAFYEFTTRYHRDNVNLGRPLGFHWVRQNCSVYSREACKAAGIHIPTEIAFTDAVSRVCPDKIKELGRAIAEGAKRSTAWIREITPQKVADVCKKVVEIASYVLHCIADFFTAFVLLPFRALLGDLRGSDAAAFQQLDQPVKALDPPWYHFLSLSRFKINLPGIAREWQLQQPSTVVYPKGTQKLTIVPN